VEAVERLLGGHLASPNLTNEEEEINRCLDGSISRDVRHPHSCSIINRD
jgi:hypothetical protein